MRAIVVDRWTEPSLLRVGAVDPPEVRPGTIEVEVRAAGVNFFDILMVQGRYQVKPPFPFIPGGEIAGVVRSVGAGVEDFAEGDRVLAHCGIGGYAERVLIDARDAYVMPDGLDYEAGAALPIAYATSYAGLVFRADLAEGEDLLVHAAAGGVGIAAVQIGAALGARVIATGGGPDKCEIALRAGAHEAIDYRNEDFAARVMELTEGKGADVIYDSVGGDTTDRSLKCIAWNGRLVVIGFASGAIPEIRANRILLKNIAVTGLHWSAFPEKDPDKIPITYEALFLLHNEGRIAPLIYDTYPLERLPEALAALGSRRTHGKLIVTP